METSGRIWPNFELIQALMHVLITCKYENDPIKNSRENVMTSFYQPTKERYYDDDLIHLSISGTKRLLGEIEEIINIVESFENCTFKSQHQKRGRVQKRFSQTSGQRSSNGPRRDRPSQNRGWNTNNEATCYKCGETNHETRQCRHKEQLKCHYCGFFCHKSGRCLNQ